jgi:hypothetical protein
MFRSLCRILLCAFPSYLCNQGGLVVHQVFYTHGRQLLVDTTVTSLPLIAREFRFAAFSSNFCRAIP